jgi:hypothetical protein
MKRFAGKTIRDHKILGAGLDDHPLEFGLRIGFGRGQERRADISEVGTLGRRGRNVR